MAPGARHTTSGRWRQRTGLIVFLGFLHPPLSFYLRFGIKGEVQEIPPGRRLIPEPSRLRELAVEPAVVVEVAQREVALAEHRVRRAVLVVKLLLLPL